MLPSLGELSLNCGGFPCTDHGLLLKILLVLTTGYFFFTSSCLFFMAVCKCLPTLMFLDRGDLLLVFMRVTKVGNDT